MGLKRYQQKRDFARTPEPSGKTSRSRKGNFFVIQKHQARRLHYDFRLEMEGVLKSWAVPKGLPYARGEKRLAVHVEDHPLSYAKFEGIIPPDNYGAGTVMVWDLGTYQIEGDNPVAGLKKGKFDFSLQGKKLKGSWALVRLKGSETEKEPWLVIKREKDIKPLSQRQDDRSALTGRSMKQIAAEQGAVWESKRSSKGKKKNQKKGVTPGKKISPFARLLKRLPPGKPAFVPPMKARLVDEFPASGDWQIEIKLDGIRAIAVINSGSKKIYSRNHLDLGRRFPDIVPALSQINCVSAVLDGEVVALDKKGRSSFQLLQHRGSEDAPLFYYLFDLLQLNGKDTKGLALEKRRELLKRLLDGSIDPLRYSAEIEGDPELILKEAKKLGLEGLIAKCAGSRYEPGKRSGSWVKIKVVNQQEFVIGGFTDPKGTRPHFGALLVGYYQDGKLLFASKVGTGFDQETLRSLSEKMKKIISLKCPFRNVPQTGPLGLSRAEMARCHWVKPKLIAEIRFAEWTRDGHLRQPVFLGLRVDKKPHEVVREGSR